MFYFLVCLFVNAPLKWQHWVIVHSVRELFAPNKYTWSQNEND